jgi:hypothetical protein
MIAVQCPGLAGHAHHPHHSPRSSSPRSRIRPSADARYYGRPLPGSGGRHIRQRQYQCLPHSACGPRRSPDTSRSAVSYRSHPHRQDRRLLRRVVQSRRRPHRAAMEGHREHERREGSGQGHPGRRPPIRHLWAYQHQLGHHLRRSIALGLPCQIRPHGHRLSVNGPNNDGPPAATARDHALAVGHTINALAVPAPEQSSKDLALSLDPDEGVWRQPLDYLHSNVTGGPNSFATTASTLDDYSSALRRKIIAEIAGSIHGIVWFESDPAAGPSAAGSGKPPKPLESQS